MPFPHLAEAEEFENRTVTRMFFAWEEATVQSGNTVNIPLQVQRMLYFAEQTTGAFCSLGRLYPWTAQPDAEVLTLAESCKGRSNATEVNRFKLIENKKSGIQTATCGRCRWALSQHRWAFTGSRKGLGIC